MRHAFRLVDVFTDRPFAGNQLAVVLDAEELDAGPMQEIAREFGFSETTFVTRTQAEGCDWRVRIFTPADELPMAGHPTIGTAVALQALGRAEGRTVFELGVGPTPVTVRPGWAEMDQRPPTFGADHPDPAALARALSIEPEDVLRTELRPRSVSTGLSHVMMPVATLAAVRRLQPRPDELRAAMEALPGQAVYAFTREAERPGSSAHCRMFAPFLGMKEDPATGSAAGPLACYLAAAEGGADGTVAFRFEQGFEIGRESLLEASVERSGGAITAVRVGGAAQIVGEGWLTTG